MQQKKNDTIVVAEHASFDNYENNRTSSEVNKTMTNPVCKQHTTPKRSVSQRQATKVSLGMRYQMSMNHIENQVD